MSDALTSDELGEVGESLFNKLCAQAKLVCNKSGRDRTGWDFRVEFPMDSLPDATLDQREPRVCQVQLKCTAGERGIVQARLSAIERIAKDSAPAAIVVFRMRPDGTELMGYVIHLLNKELARVLRRLRAAQKAGRADINHMSISFDYRKGRRFKPGAAGLREALAEVSPEDMGAYTAEKLRQLATLGYEDGSGVEAEALIWIEDEDHLTRIISGLAPLKPLKLQAYDRRFDIRVPYMGTMFEGIDEFAIDLPTMGPCSIIVRTGALRPAALFKCEAFVPYPVEGGPWLVIRHPALNLLFHEDRFHIESLGNFNVGRHDLETWVQLLRGLTYLAEGSATVELEFRGARIPGIPTPEGLDGPYLDQLPRLLDFVEGFQRALDLAGTIATEEFSLEDLWAAPAAQMSLDMFFNPATAARFEFDDIGGVTDELVLEALYFNTIEFAGTGISFAVKVTLERGDESSRAFASTRFELLDIRSAVLDLDGYGAEMATTKEISVVINPSNVTMVNRQNAEGRSLTSS